MSKSSFNKEDFAYVLKVFKEMIEKVSQIRCRLGPHGKKLGKKPYSKFIWKCLERRILDSNTFHAKKSIYIH